MQSKTASSRFKRELPLYLMILVPVIFALVYNYFPLVGYMMAFVDYTPSSKGFLYAVFHSKFIGFDTFKMIFTAPDTFQVIFNTLFISVLKWMAKIFVPLIFALLLNEVTKKWFGKMALTITYIPFFLSWVVLGNILLTFFSPQDGTFNQVLTSLGLPTTYFFGTPNQFPFAVVLSDLWQQIGYNTIIYLAALTSVDVGMYEAASVDGAGRLKQMLYLTLPSITPIVILVAILGLGNILNAGQDQILNLYSPAVYSTGDVIDTYAFRMGIQNGLFSIATAVGLFKSVVTFIMISLSYLIANKFTNYKVI